MNKKRLFLFLAAFIITIFLTRLYLYFNSTSNLYIGSYNIHHLYVGLLFITFSGTALTILEGKPKWLNLSAIIFGIGLSLALDEWVYLVATDGSDKAYLYPISFWGAVVMTMIVILYTLALYYINKRK